MNFSLAGLVAVGLMFSSVSATQQESAQERNKKTVVAFYEKAINDKDFEAARRYIGGRYVQHNPMAADGIDGLKGFLSVLKERNAEWHSEIKQVFADGDFVILHVLAKPKPADRGFAVVDIFRLEDGKVVEHWDVIQAVPEKAANGNGMF